MSDCYHDHPRPEVAALVASGAETVLDLGCGSGALGEALKARQRCRVWGVEGDRGAAEEARGRLDGVCCGDLEEPAALDHVTEEAGVEAFDCLVCADVLEHLRNPEELLRRLLPCLAEGGRLVVSVPNSRNWNVIARLLEGHVGYESAGLLDRTHLRLFTCRELETMLWRCGYEVETLRPVLDPAHSQWLAAGRPRAVGVPPFVYHAPTEAEAEDLFVYQWLCVARKRPPQPRVSIIVPVWNALEYTRECLEALTRTTVAERTDLLVVDNGSTDGSGGWLDAWAREDGRRVVLHNENNEGFARACNRGLRFSLERLQPEYLVLLNNDTLPGTGWLDALCETFTQSPRIGAAGPVSNYVSGAQQVATPCTRRDQIESWAWRWSRRSGSLWVGTERLVGFCLALRPEAVRQVGLLDERFGLGTYEDDDYCRRLRRAGWRLMIAPGSFVWHWGNRTFEANGVSMQECQERNAEVFEGKWGERREHRSAGA